MDEKDEKNVSDAAREANEFISRTNEIDRQANELDRKANQTDRELHQAALSDAQHKDLFIATVVHEFRNPISPGIDRPGLEIRSWEQNWVMYDRPRLL